MIRRVLSIILFILGGWLFTGEPMMAFLDFPPDESAAKPFVLLGVVIVAAVPLLLGALASPGRRWRELGLTILIATGVGLFCGLCVIAVFNDPGFEQFRPVMPPMPEFTLAPITGTVNALVVIAIGWLLYRGRRADLGTSPV